MVDAFTEGAHTVTITVSAEGYINNSEWLAISDPGVDTILRDADGRARDADQHGNVFEDVATHFHEVVVQAAAANGSFGETPGIVEFDTSTIPAGAIIESAVLSVDVSGTAHFPGNDIVMDVFGYEGNGVVESSDANEQRTIRRTTACSSTPRPALCSGVGRSTLRIPSRPASRSIRPT
jgi:hypothetical protein